MRTPALACAIFAAAVLSPSLVSATPLPSFSQSEAKLLEAGRHVLPSTSNTARSLPATNKIQNDIVSGSHQPIVSSGTLKTTHVVSARSVPSLSHLEQLSGHAVQVRDEPDGPRRGIVGTAVMPTNKIEPRHLAQRALDSDTAGGNAYSGSASDASGGGVRALSHSRFTYYPRTDDTDTMGGNAYTGATGDVSGGSIANIASNDGMPTLMNFNSNNAGAGGTSQSGCASGGLTNTTTSAAGNAYSGSAGNAKGGSVSNVGGMVNMNSNNGGAAGTSASGCALGGDVGVPKTSVDEDSFDSIDSEDPWDFY